MQYARVLRYANVQARVRARIGLIPEASALAAAADDARSGLLDGLGSREGGFWLEGLSPNAGGDALERHFAARARALVKQGSRWLPKGWERFARLLTLAPDIFWVGAVLDGVTDGAVMDRASVMHRVLHAAPEQRRQLLGQTAFAPYIAADRPPTHAWREDLRRAIPEIPTGERRPLARLLACLDDYFARLDDEFKRIAADPDSAHSSGDSAPGAWTHHRNLERRLRLLLAGDPFHPALILIYLLLEFLAMEKLRALMLARLRGWPAPDALTAAH